MARLYTRLLAKGAGWLPEPGHPGVVTWVNGTTETPAKGFSYVLRQITVCAKEPTGTIPDVGTFLKVRMWLDTQGNTNTTRNWSMFLALTGTSVPAAAALVTLRLFLPPSSRVLIENAAQTTNRLDWTFTGWILQWPTPTQLPPV
jgi:hypothetical protein